MKAVPQSCSIFIFPLSNHGCVCVCRDQQQRTNLCRDSTVSWLPLPGPEQSSRQVRVAIYASAIQYTRFDFSNVKKRSSKKGFCCSTYLKRMKSVLSSVVDPDLYDFGPPGSVSQSTDPDRNPFHHQAKIARKTLIFLLFCDFFLNFYLWKIM